MKYIVILDKHDFPLIAIPVGGVSAEALADAFYVEMRYKGLELLYVTNGDLMKFKIMKAEDFEVSGEEQNLPVPEKPSSEEDDIPF